MPIKLTIRFDATDDVWYAFDGATENESRHIGQGTSPEAACTDYWYQAHGDAAELSYDEEAECWLLHQGCYRAEFQTKQAAVDYANANEWQIKNWRNLL
jgi:hypothetical protein